MAKFKEPQDRGDGWTDWETPTTDGYKMACCECGLVHNINFRAIEITKNHADKTFDYETLPAKKYRVKFQISRNNRSTGQIRRHQNITLKTTTVKEH